MMTPGDTATNHEVHLWFQARFANFKQRGPITKTQADAYNRANPDRPYLGPTKNTAAWSSLNESASKHAAKLTSTQGRKAACIRHHGPTCGCWSQEETQ